MITTDAELAQLIQSSRRIAIVGLSNKPDRPSYQVAAYLLAHGFSIIPVNPIIDEVLGQPAFKTLEAIPHPVDLVDVFRRSEDVPPIVEAAIRIQAPAIWLQQGVIHSEAAAKAEAAGMKVVMDRCIKIDHRRLFT